MTTVKLGDVADFVNGVAFKEEDWHDSGRKIIRIQNLNDESKPFNLTNREVADKNIARPGDLLISWAASLGVYVWSGPEACINQHIFKVVPIKEKVDKNYLRHALEASLETMEKQMHGATMKHITRGKFLDTEIPLPSVPEQRRIAAILDKAEALRSKRREAIAKLDQLLQSVFLEMFGDPADKKINWPSFTLETVATTRLGKMLDKKTSQGENMKKYLANLNVQWGRFVLDDLREMNFDVADQQEFNLLPGDILMCEGGEPGRCAIWEDDVKDCYFQKALHRIRCNKEKCTPEYISYLFYILAKNGKFKSSITTATIAHLPGIKLKKLEIPVPPIDLQRKFSNLFNEIRSSQLKNVNSFKKIDILNSSIQTSFFTN